MKLGTGILVAIALVGIAVLAYCVISDYGQPDMWSTGAHSKIGKRIGELDDGCRQYKQDTKYFPGQSGVIPIGSGKDQLTGAQILARAMFTKTMPDGKTQYPTSNYATYKESDLIDADGRTGVISDGHPTNPMPILYYPARFGVDGMAQYVEADNAVHTDGHKGGNFREFITDMYFKDKKIPYNDGEFLLISAGAGRKYFSDDIGNWSK